MIRHLLVVSRPRFWLYLAGPALVGAVYGAETLSALLAPVPALLVAYFLVPANVLLYGVNDAFDADVDAYNPKKEGRETRFEGDRVVVVAVAASGLLALGFVPVLPPLAVLWFGAFLLLAIEYSAPPLRFKTTPLLDSLSNGLYVLPGAVTYAALAGRSPPILALVGGWAWTMAMHTFSAIPDIEPDRDAGIETTATVLGEQGSYAYCGALWLVAAGCFAILDARAGLVLGLYPALVAGVAVGDVDVHRAYWWYPVVNAAVGMVLTLGGLWRLANG
jgi:4-hydroxybenzoate polyprenyltransferase